MITKPDIYPTDSVEVDPQTKLVVGEEVAELLARAREDAPDARQHDSLFLEEDKLLGKTTKPESRRYETNEPYRFLVHVPLRDIRGSFEYLGGQSGYRIEEGGRPVNASLVDGTHTTTFEGASGFILKSPESDDDITGVWAKDVGADTVIDGTKMTGDEMLAATEPGEYNQVHTKSIGGIEGVFIRVAADTGEEIGVGQANQALRTLAIEQGLPVAEIVVSPREIKEGELKVREVQRTSAGDLSRIILPRDGFEYRIDVLTGASVSYADNQGMAVRIARVNRYDVWDRRLTNDEIASISKTLAGAKDLNPAVAQAISKELTKISAEVTSLS